MFFYAVHRNTRDSAMLEEVDRLLTKFDRGEVVLCTSAIVHIEASAERLKDTPKKYKFLSRLYEEIEIVNSNSRVIKLAAEIRDHYARGGNTLSTPDSIHLASALYVGASEFHTCDGTGAESGRGKLLKLTRPIAGKYDIDIKVPRIAQPGLFAKVAAVPPPRNSN